MLIQHYKYVSPEGKEFTSITKAHEHVRTLQGKKGGKGGKSGAGKGSSAKPAAKGSGGKKKRGRAGEDDLMEFDASSPRGGNVVPREKSGGPLDRTFLRDYEHKWFHKRFEDSRKWLEAQGHIAEGDDCNSLADLAHLAAILQQSMHIHLGRDARRSKRAIMMRLPHKLYQDTQEGGALCLMLAAILGYMRENGLSLHQLERTLCSGPKSDVLTHGEFFVSLRQQLRDGNHLPCPAVFFSLALASDLSAAEMAELEAFVRTSGGTVVDNEEEATHTVVPDTEDMESDDQTFLRTIAVRKKVKDLGDVALVHWWFFPDSYDDWVPIADVHGETPDLMKPPAKWRVCVRWLRDTIIFNEWMNEEDYLPEDPIRENEGELLAEGEDVTDAKEAKRWSLEEDQILHDAYKKYGQLGSDVWSRISTLLPGRSVGSVKTRFRLAHKNGDLWRTQARPPQRDEDDDEEGRKKKRRRRGDEEDEGGRRRAKDGPKFKPRQLTVQNECWFQETDRAASFLAEPQLWDLEPCPEDEGPGERIDGELSSINGLLVGDGTAVDKAAPAPSPLPPLILAEKSRWFDPSTVDARERAALPEFFSGEHVEKTPESYVRVRNAIVAEWGRHVVAHVEASAASWAVMAEQCAEAEEESRWPGNKRVRRPTSKALGARRSGKAAAERTDVFDTETRNREVSAEDESLAAPGAACPSEEAPVEGGDVFLPLWPAKMDSAQLLAKVFPPLVLVLPKREIKSKGNQLERAGPSVFDC